MMLSSNCASYDRGNILNYNNIDIKFKNLKLINNKYNLLFNKKEFCIF